MHSSKKNIHKIIWSLFLLLITISLSAKEYNQITPSEVYQEAIKIDKEIELLQSYFNIKTTEKINIGHVPGEFKPKHVWQLAYMLNVKINMFRVKNNLPRMEEVGMEPVLKVKPNIPYGMLLRVNNEIQIIKRFLNIKIKISQTPSVKDKTPTDVLNKLLHISKELDILNNQGINPSAVFAQVMRLYQDVSTVLSFLNISDNTFPPAKNENSKPKDAFVEVQNFNKYLKRLQRVFDIDRTDFSGLQKDTFIPEDTFILVGMANAEFQTIKAYLGLIHEVTPPAIFYKDKTPSDVEQLIGWLTKRIQLINTLEVK